MKQLKPCNQLEHLQQCVVAFQGQCSVAPCPPLQQAAETKQLINTTGFLQNHFMVTPTLQSSNHEQN